MWINLVERWFKELFDGRLRRGVFTSVPDLIAAIELWAAHCAVAVPPSTRSHARPLEVDLQVQLSRFFETV